ncbi:PREDICTED: pentatricopeptide repeat-containing protein At1g20230 [Nicotiana attenuata]|uniref:Pentatricopeptide repeat-containing protein n=1 Tax=Nicotiana attenuata TaxID=49451 RepID=A0A1J6J0L4_NICAT|nr:PREDICTED: pentatricopeptide repeat-containing protein At1g20230 [Nicotiana attenuata]OIT06312.1 pentatricopeptide repeat-containing protein [Nicotiana attenuata]
MSVRQFQTLRAFDTLNHNSILSLITKSKSLSQTQQIHAHILKTGNSNDTYFTNNLLSLYLNCQRFTDAESVLHSLPNPNIFSFKALIHASSKSNLFSYTLVLFSRLISACILPDVHILPSAIKACAGLSAVEVGKQVHGFGLTSGLALDSFVEASLVHMYVKCNQLKCARKVFDKMLEPDLVSWSALASGYARRGDVVNAKLVFDQAGKLGIEPNLVSWNGIIAGFNQSGCYPEAVCMFLRMYSEGFRSDGASISSVLPAIGDLEDLKMGVQVHCHVIKMGLECDICIISALIDMYGKCRCTLEMSRVFEGAEETDLGAFNALVAGLSRNGLVDEAFKVFKKFKRRGTELNVVSWTSMIGSCSQHGKDLEALEIFREMQLAKVMPNSVTISSLLPACGNIAALVHGKATHCFSLRNCFPDDVYVGSALIDMYANCGRIQVARLVFDRMPVRNLVCWNAMTSGYAMHGKAKEAIEIFELMQRSGQKPDFISFTSVLSACSQAGLIEQGQYYFNSMSRVHGLQARVEHYACMVSLLGRAGKLKEAYSMMSTMPVEPDSCVWGALLSSCRLHRNTSLGEIAANKLFELEPKNPGNYILLSNIYASNNRWKEVDRVRDRMKYVGLSKNPGCSWIEIKNKVHMLLAGDDLHPQMPHIMEKLRKLSMDMKNSGVSHDMDFVLQDVEEQDKELILCGHSEKLAVVLGILNTNPGTPLSVIKNLRICGDCHLFIKFISSFEGREIYVRDTNRFHHFNEGVCSCGDYW